MSSYYIYDDFGRYDGETTVATPRSTTIAPPRLSSEFNWNGQAWVYAPDVVSVVASIGLDRGFSHALSASEAIRKIDTDTDKIYEDVLGNRASEYNRAEVEAEQFKAENYALPAPDSVLAWADAKGWDVRTAADDILLQARKWRDAQQKIRRIRLKEKEAIRQALGSEVPTILARWQQFVGEIRVQLGVSYAGL